jgi:hypothetical protein
MTHYLVSDCRYFAQTSSGILQNRFSRDVFVIDQVLPRVLQGQFSIPPRANA